MAGDKGLEQSSEAKAQTPNTSAPVFISYASPDVAIANSLVEELEQQGIRCWIAPRDVPPGLEYADEIVGAINNASVIVLVLSEHAVASAHVGREVERAASKHRGIITLRLDSTPLTRSFEYFLSQSQWIDVIALGLQPAMLKLTHAVRQRTAATSWVSPGLGTDVSNPTETVRRLSYRFTRRAGLAAVSLFGVAVFIGVMFRYWPPKRGSDQSASATVISDKSIAVLPFADMSQKRDQEYFGDGMAEEILDLLAKIPGLTVIGRTSSFQFKGKNEDLRTIGARLNAAYVLEGSVRNSGDRVRITAQLIGAQDGVHLWSSTYDRRMDDVLKLQDEIAIAVARELQLAIAPGFLQARSTVKDAEAYDLLLRGRHSGDRLDQEGLNEAVNLFQQALNRDPTSVDAAAALAWAYDAQGEWGVKPPVEAFELARGAAGIALKLDPKNALSHFVLGRIHVVYDWDWAAAKSEFEQVAALAPGKGDALDSEALLLLANGHWDDALGKLNTSLSQDPMDPPSLFILAEIQIRRAKLPEAEAAIRRALSIRPTQAYAHVILGLIMLAKGDRDAALLAMQQETAEDGQQTGVAVVYYALGKTPESDAALAGVVNKYADSAALAIAEVYSYRGQVDEAMHWLDRAYAQKDSGLYAIKGDPLLKNVESDPRYKALLKKMNLPEG
jgi:TolB-like protein/Tfp pilus assembly protein PilF